MNSLNKAVVTGATSGIGCRNCNRIAKFKSRGISNWPKG